VPVKGGNSDNRVKSEEYETSGTKEDFSGGVKVFINEKEDYILLIDELLPLITKVRAVVQMFRQSPMKNDMYLQKYAKKNLFQALQIKIVTKTRRKILFSFSDFQALKLY
jgi:hypothetical protein